MNAPFSVLSNLGTPFPSSSTSPSFEQVDEPKSDADNAQTVFQLIDNLSDTVDGMIGEIRKINSNTKLLALNARIEAARASSSGAAFGVVAQEMQALAAKTSDTAERMATHTSELILELQQLIGGSIRGTRLSDLALTNIDLIDRCLYERTCDVRWWATDGSLTAAVAEPSSANAEYASQRMGVILNAYTVYLDLVLCDSTGKIIANGRPEVYRSVGGNVGTSEWFRTAIMGCSKDGFGFQSAHASNLVQGKPTLIYSCPVLPAYGEPAAGVLGILFDWDSLAGTILRNIPISERERNVTSSFIVDDSGRILARSGKDCSLEYWPQELQGVLNQQKSFTTCNFDRRRVCLAHAYSPGFETYATGWHSLIAQDL